MNNSKKYIAIILTLAFFLTASLQFTAVTTTQAAVKTYYVSPTGDDANSGTIDSPFKTLYFVSTRVIHTGDTLILRGGTYMDDSFWVTSNGTEKSPITIKAYEGETPVISGNGGQYSSMLFLLGSKYYIIDGLTIKDANETCYDTLSMSGATNVTIRNCTFKDLSNNGYSMISATNITNVVIENCVLDNKGTELVYVDDTNIGAGAGDGITFNGANHCIIQGCYFVNPGLCQHCR